MDDKTKTNTNPQNNISYEGIVSITLNKNKKKIKTLKYKNTGKLPLFRFIVDCLRGSYSIAEPHRPKYIQLFTAGSKGTLVSTINVNSILQNSDNLITPQKIIYQSTPLTTYDNNNDEASITFKFMIPYSQLKTIENINLMALYDQDSFTSNSKIPSAYFLLTKLDGSNTVLDSLLDDTTVDNSYSIYIQWKLVVKNK
jgi:hypothetical protein